MKLKCIAIDDMPFALDLIRLYAERIPELQLVQTFEDAISGAEFMKQNPVDLLFVDINMPDISGLDLVRSLQVKPLIVFTTAYKNYAFEGFELEALDYLLKPIEFERFAKAVQKALDLFKYRKKNQTNTEESFFVYSEYQAIQIIPSEICYIESLKNYLKIHLDNKDVVTTAMSLKKIQEKLPEGQFLRIHRSYVVPTTKVRSIQNRKVLLTCGTILPVGDSYAQAIQAWKNA
jgi:two-component system, LytTR family, response regulator